MKTNCIPYLLLFFLIIAMACDNNELPKMVKFIVSIEDVTNNTPIIDPKITINGRTENNYYQGILHATVEYGAKDILVEHDEYLDYQEDITFSDDNDTLKIKLIPLRSTELEIKVLDKEGEFPVESAIVEIRNITIIDKDGWIINGSFELKTDSNGDLKISQLTQGNYDFIVKKSGYYTYSNDPVELKINNESFTFLLEKEP